MEEFEQIFVAIILLVRIFFATVEAPVVPQHVSDDNTIRVIRVIDGDTFEARIATSTEKIRMIGIDTPESVDPRRPVQCFGKEAGAHLQQLIINREIRLEDDQSGDDRDKYGRLLRYVYIEGDVLVNARMIEDGYAYAYTKFPFEKRAQFLKLQTQARAGLRGLWASDTCRGRRERPVL